MRFPSILLPLLSLLPFSLSEPTIQTTSTPSHQKATIHYHILAPNTLPSPLAELTYASSPSFEALQLSTVDSFTPPPPPPAGGNATTTQELVQIGIYDKSIGGLRAPTSVLSTSAFSQADQSQGQGQGHFRIHLAPDGESVWSVSYHNIPTTTSSRTAEENGKGKEKGNKAKALPTFEIVYPKQGPRPVLNRPVALTKEGKVLGKEEVDERGFIQKYWWVFLGVAVLAMAGGGGEQK